MPPSRAAYVATAASIVALSWLAWRLHACTGRARRERATWRELVMAMAPAGLDQGASVSAALRKTVRAH